MTWIIILSVLFILILYALRKSKSVEENEHQEIIDNIKARIAKSNGASITQFSLENTANQSLDETYKNADFINKNCHSLDDFLINEHLNKFDLFKLAELNGIQLQISSGWYDLTLDLIKELYAKGWDKRVSCIKEKYASLRFYNSGGFNEITKKYERLSENVCETCGERGEIRYNTSWNYVACRKHYLENRGTIITTSNGFIFNNENYRWNEVLKANLTDKDHNERYRFLTLELKENKVKHEGWQDNKVYISKNVIGFGNFLKNIPEKFKTSNRAYFEKYKNPTFCKVCGYLAVYDDFCECCEKGTWENYQRRSNKLSLSRLKYNQMSWAEDEGEIYEKIHHNYPKNPNFKILYTQQELDEFIE